MNLKAIHDRLTVMVLLRQHFAALANWIHGININILSADGTGGPPWLSCQPSIRLAAWTLAHPYVSNSNRFPGEDLVEILFLMRII